MEIKNVIGGLMLGLALGIAIGMLLAPAKGKESVDKLVKGSQRLSRKAKKEAKAYASSLQDKFSSGVDDLSKEGKEVINGLSA